MEIIFLMISTLFIRCQSGLTELHKDRFVLREYTSFEMDCNHNLEKLTRIKWDFNSNPTNDNKTETIYESWHPDKILKSGFEVSCQPHETLISKCSLKLVQTRKEDSGKYICYVEQEDDAEFDSNALKPVTEIELVVRGPSNKTMLANKDDRVILPCEHNIKNLTRARWSHVSTKGVLTYAIYHMPAKETSNKNYEVQCEPHELYCNLKILKANKESAGKYICKVGESQEFEKKYGLDSLTHFIEIELVVGELECNENMKKDLTLIGENDCYGIEADVLNLKCSFNYFGNINYNLLHLRWIEKYKFNSLEKKLNSSPINHEVKDETKKISIQTNLSVAYEMQNSIFQCVLDDTQVKPCQLHEFRTQYIKNTTKRSPPIYSNDLHNMKCLANKSSNVQCSYYWVHQIAGAMVETPYPSLPVEHMNSPGIYTCIAKCHLRSNKECIIKAMEVEVVQGSNISGLVVGLIVGLILGVAATISLYILCKKYVRKRFKVWKNKNNLTEPLLGEVGCETKDLVVQEKKQERNKEDEHEITRFSPSTRKPLKVKKVLHEKMTMHHEIKIYEATNSDNGKVLMIDGAVWDAELDKFSYQRMMGALPIRSHQNPMKVLVIGGGEVRLVNELVENPEVESITVCEVDGELLAMCQCYVPSLTPSLEDDKVKINIEDGFEFLKKTEDTFDVIINHSSDSEGPSKYLFTKEYYELVKSKLNNRGVVATIVNGKDASGSDVLEQTTMKFCKQLFPKVHYFYIPVFNHPNGVVRSLVCSLDDETSFKILFGEMNDEYKMSDVMKIMMKSFGIESYVKEFMKTFLDLLKEEGLERSRKELEKGVKVKDEYKPHDKPVFEGDMNEYLKKIASGPSIIHRNNEMRLNRRKRMWVSEKSGYKMLNVRKVLREEKSKHHKIRIYKSINLGKVFMLDGAIWMTETYSFRQEVLTSTPLISHKNPKDVLVIGGGDGAIVKNLLKYSKVESITVFEIDERIIELTRKYFPSLACCLDDPKVKVHVGDGNEFMKKQKKAFDVIFIRSSTVQDGYINDKYYNAVKGALKEGGVVSLDVTEKDTEDDKYDMDADAMGTRAMDLCDKYFPVVYYFHLPFQEHNGTMTKCLMCSLNNEINFMLLFKKVQDEMEAQIEAKRKSKLEKQSVKKNV